MPKTYTVKEVAEILGYSTNSIYSFLRDKRINGIRVGKGRFRIPEEELRRVLHLSKNQTPESTPQLSAPAAPAAPAVRTDPLEIMRPVQTFQEDAAVLAKPAAQAPVPGARITFVPPNLFDWFVGTAALIAGLALYLFNALYEAAAFTEFTSFVSTARIILVASGIGVILASMLDGKVRGWRNTFYVIIALCGFANVYFLLRGGDVDGAALYGGIALIVTLRLFLPLGGIVSFGAYLSTLAISLPLLFLAYPTDTHLTLMSSLMGVPTTTIGLGLSLLSILFLVMFWVGYTMSTPLFVITVIFSALAQLGGAVYLAGINFWSRAFFLVVVAFYTVSLPTWRTIQYVCSRRQRTILHTLFAGIGIMFVIALVVVYIMQQNAWSEKRAEFANKVTAAQDLVRMSVTSVKSSLTVSAANPDLSEAYLASNTAELSRIGKIIYESNPNIRRLVFLDAEGDGIALYPYGTFDQPNFAFRDYFMAVRDTRAPYISNVFMSKVDMAGRYVVVVAVPVLTSDGTFAGALTASLDLERIGTQVQSLAIESEGEYFVLFDAKNMTLYHPTSEVVGTAAPENDAGRLAVSGESGVVKSYLRDGRSGMIAYAQIPDIGWAVTLRVPATRAFDLTSDAVLSVFGIIAFVLLAALIYLLYFRVTFCDVREGGP